MYEINDREEIIIKDDNFEMDSSLYFYMLDWAVDMSKNFDIDGEDIIEILIDTPLLNKTTKQQDERLKSKFNERHQLVCPGDTLKETITRMNNNYKRGGSYEDI